MLTIEKTTKSLKGPETTKKFVSAGESGGSGKEGEVEKMGVITCTRAETPLDGELRRCNGCLSIRACMAADDVDMVGVLVPPPFFFFGQEEESGFPRKLGDII